MIAVCIGTGERIEIDPNAEPWKTILPAEITFPHIVKNPDDNESYLVPESVLVVQC